MYSVYPRFIRLEAMSATNFVISALFHTNVHIWFLFPRAYVRSVYARNMYANAKAILCVCNLNSVVFVFLSAKF